MGIILPVIDNAIMLALFVQVSIQWMFLTSWRVNTIVWMWAVCKYGEMRIHYDLSPATADSSQYSISRLTSHIRAPHLTPDFQTVDYKEITDSHKPQEQKNNFSSSVEFYKEDRSQPWNKSVSSSNLNKTTIIVILNRFVVTNIYIVHLKVPRAMHDLSFITQLRQKNIAA